jgi:vacuolar-type H+-ATPase subunit F/Vma7
LSHRIRAVASPPLAAGLRLAGVPADDVPSAAAAAERVTQLAADPELGILLVEQPLYDAFTAPLRHDLETRALPIVVPVPVPRWGAPADRAEAYILDLLRRAIGYRVRLQ